MKTIIQPIILTILATFISVFPPNENKSDVIKMSKINFLFQQRDENSEPVLKEQIAGELPCNYLSNTSPLLNSGAKLRIPGPNLDKQLIEAARCGTPSAVKNLIAKGANPDARGPNGITPLMIAAARGNVGIGTALIEKGADLNLPDTTEWKMAPLLVASACGRFEFVELLLNKSARVTITDKANATAWAYATLVDNKERSSKIQKLLLSKGTPAINADSTTLFFWVADNPAFDCANSYLKNRFKGQSCSRKKAK